VAAQCGSVSRRW